MDSPLTDIDVKNLEKKVFTYQSKLRPSRKLYVNALLAVDKVFKNTVLLLDTGADICILNYSTLLTLHGYDEISLRKKIKPAKVSITGFTGNSVEVMGFVTYNLRFKENGLITPVHFYVVDFKHRNMPTAGILGISAITYLRLSITSYCINNRIVPSVYRNLRDGKEEVKAHFLSERELNEFLCYVVVPKNSTNTVLLPLSSLINYSCQNFDCNDVYLVESTYTLKGIHVIPSTSTISEYMGTKVLKSTICNFTNKPYEGNIKFSLELLQDPDIVTLNKSTIAELSTQPLLVDICFGEGDELPIANNYLQNFDTYQNSINTIHIAYNTEPQNFLKNTSLNYIREPIFPEKKLKYDPYCENNGCTGSSSLTDDRYPVKIEGEGLKEDFGGKDTLNLNPKEIDIQNLDPDIKGFELPPKNYQAIEAIDLLNLQKYDPDIKDYVYDIFEKKYPQVISKHDFDLGNLDLLGSYTLKLKKGAILPKLSKLYYLSPSDSLHLKDILNFMMMKDIISPCEQGGQDVGFACPSYLIPRKNGKVSRLIINYSYLNSLLVRDYPTIPTADSIINSLRNSAFYSNLDLTGAFNMISLSKDCRHLTSFSCPFGIYKSHKVITGGANSPSALFKFMDKVLNYDVLRDKDGQIIMEMNDKNEKVAKLRHSPLQNTLIFYDDIIVHSPWKGDYEKTKKHHFFLLEKLIERLCVFGAKISIAKCEFYKNKIKFLGWEILGGKIIRPDKQRVNKILDFELPTTARGFRAFLGCVSSIRNCLGMSVLKHVSILSPLTSSYADHANPTQEQIEAFQNIKKALTSAPLFSNLVDSQAAKILYTDASSSHFSSIGGILLQCVEPKNGIDYVEPYLFLQDPCHRLIHMHDLKCIPTPYIKNGQTDKEFLQTVSPYYPCETEYLEKKNHGFENVHSLLNITLKTLFCLNNMTHTEDRMTEIILKVHKHIRTDIIGNQILSNIFKNDKDSYNEYLRNLKEWDIEIDSFFYIFQVFADILLRPFVLISSLEKDKENPIITYRGEIDKPPFFILLYQGESAIICRGAYIDKSRSFDLAKFRGNVEIIGYYCHTLPSALKSNHILEKEAYGVVSSLEYFRKIIGSSEILLVTDSTSLYFIFSKLNMDSSSKLTRWGYRIFSIYPQLKITFCKSGDNISDFFTRNFNLKPSQFKLTGMERFESKIDLSLMEHLHNKTFTIEEWKNFCLENPQYLVLPQGAIDRKLKHDNIPKVLALKKNKPNPTIKQSIQNMLNIRTSLNALYARINNEEIIRLQKIEFQELYESLLVKPIQIKGSITFKLREGMILRKGHDDDFKIYLPTDLVDLVIAYFHICGNHAGVKRLIANLDQYYNKILKSKAKTFIKACLACFINNYDTTAEKFGYFNCSSQPFESVHIDYIESLPPIRGYKHLLVFVDIFTLATFSFPMKTKTSTEFLDIFIFFIYQCFRPKQVYCDNSKTFINEHVLSTLASLNINVLMSAINHAYSHGLVESFIKLQKTQCRKFLTMDSNQSWLYLPALICLQMNSSINPRHGRHPFELLYGQSRLSQPQSERLNEEVILHPLIQKDENRVIEERDIWLRYLEKVEDYLNMEKRMRNEKLNSGRRYKTLPLDKVVFVKRPISKGLETVYDHQMYKILIEKKTTALACRLSDGLVSIIHKNNIKVFDQKLSVFDNLPPDIKDLCIKLQANNKLEQTDYDKLLTISDFSIPQEILDLIGEDPNVILQQEFGAENDED